MAAFYRARQSRGYPISLANPLPGDVFIVAPINQGIDLARRIPPKKDPSFDSLPKKKVGGFGKQGLRRAPAALHGEFLLTSGNNAGDARGEFVRTGIFLIGCHIRSALRRILII